MNETSKANPDGPLLSDAPTAQVVQLEGTPSVRLEWVSVSAAHNAKPGPLYSKAALDAAVAAERERCAAECDRVAESYSFQDDGSAYGALESARRIRGA